MFLWLHKFVQCITGIKIHRICEFTIVALIPFTGFAQVKDPLTKYREWSRYSEINRFYQLNGFRFAWVDNKDAQSELLGILNSVDSLGLNNSDYQYQFIKGHNFQALASINDSIETDLRLTDAAIHFFTDLKFGNGTFSFSYNGLQYNPAANNDIPSYLIKGLKASLKDVIVAVQPKTIEYLAAINKLNQFLKITGEPNFKDERIITKNVDQTNKSLLLRLYQLGITDSVLKTSEKKIILEAVRKAQAQFDLLNDGILRSTTLEALNTPLKQRVGELKTAINYFRWIEAIKQNSVLLLNIPSTYLIVYGEGKIILDSKVIVGKPSTPTPTLTSTITQVILYPFWNVPHKIAVKELLPSIKRNIGFLESGNYQVLNNSGRVLDPYKINWKNLNAGNFPYHIRQSTGCDNALGIVKFEFYNPFTVYLHDTPNKALFSFSKRFFSHGCMRVEKPIELAHLLLGRNSIAIDTLTAKGCLYQQAPKPVAVEKELPVIILYSTVWYTREGEIRFYDDVYRKLNR